MGGENSSLAWVKEVQSALILYENNNFWHRISYTENEPLTYQGLLP